MVWIQSIFPARYSCITLPTVSAWKKITMKAQIDFGGIIAIGDGISQCHAIWNLILFEKIVGLAGIICSKRKERSTIRWPTTIAMTNQYMRHSVFVKGWGETQNNTVKINPRSHKINMYTHEVAIFWLRVVMLILPNFIFSNLWWNRNSNMASHLLPFIYQHLVETGIHAQSHWI